jgi:anti-sigma factor RsiW
MTPHWKEDSMSHVDEGTLHAYLDGELPPSERAAVESHLAQCATCRATLAEERGLLERASALLGSARPVERPAPPFEQLRQARRHSPWRVRVPLAWAASLALALGLGYYLRTPEPRTVSLAQDHSVAAPASAQEEKATRTVVRQHTRERASARASDQLAERHDTAISTAAPGVTGASGAVAMQPRVNVRAESPTTVSPPPVAPHPALPPPNAKTAAPRQASPPVALEEVVVTATPASAFASWPIVDRGTAAALLGENPVGLPGLPIRTLRLSPGLDRTVLVEQALDSTAVIQVFQRVASVGAQSDTSGHAHDRADEQGRTNRLARFMGRLRVEIAGPVSPDSLNRLLELIAPLP